MFIVFVYICKLFYLAYDNVLVLNYFQVISHKSNYIS